MDRRLRGRTRQRGSLLDAQRVARVSFGTRGSGVRSLSWSLVAIGVVAALGIGVAGAPDSPDAPATLASVHPVPRVDHDRTIPSESTLPEAVVARLPSTRQDLDRFQRAVGTGTPQAEAGPFIEWVSPEGRPLGLDARPPDALRVQYTLHPELSEAIFRLLRQQKVGLGQILVADARNGRLLAYAVTNPQAFGPERTYPAASLAKVVTAAAALETAPEAFESRCTYTGSPYRLTPRRLEPPRRGKEITFLRALATSNNQCFGRLAAQDLGATRLLEAFDAFGWLRPAAPGFPAGHIEQGDDAYALAQLGSGLAGSAITPLHAIRLALTLVEGRAVEPFWIERIEDASGRPQLLPARQGGMRVMPRDVAERLRTMLVETTRRGTARRAFRLRSGRPLLQEIEVAGKTGSLSGTDPKGRYEWFVGVAPADAPRVAIAVVSVHGDFFLQTSSQLAAEVLRRLFCPRGVCSTQAVERWTQPAARRIHPPPAHAGVGLPDLSVRALVSGLTPLP